MLALGRYLSCLILAVQLYNAYGFPMHSNAQSQPVFPLVELCIESIEFIEVCIGYEEHL